MFNTWDAVTYSWTEHRLRRHVGGIFNVNCRGVKCGTMLCQGYSQTVYSAHYSLQAQATLRRCNIVYLPHAGDIYYRQSGVTVTACVMIFVNASTRTIRLYSQHVACRHIALRLSSSSLLIIIYLFIICLILYHCCFVTDWMVIELNLKLFWLFYLVISVTFIYCVLRANWR